MSSVNYESNDELGYDRTVEFECGTDRSSLEKWLAWAEKHPVSANESVINVTKQSSYDGDPFQPLDISIGVTNYSDADFRAMLDHLCTYPAGKTLHMRIDDEDSSQSAPVNCELPEYSLGEWQNSKE